MRLVKKLSLGGTTEVGSGEIVDSADTLASQIREAFSIYVHFIIHTRVVHLCAILEQQGSHHSLRFRGYHFTSCLRGLLFCFRSCSRLN
jgi:hypothetical protein